MDFCHYRISPSPPKIPFMKKMLVFFLGLLAAGETVWACTTFLIHKNGKYAFGRNYDWVTDVGAITLFY